mmetsp:Transcript_4172/g.15621  ORF Transcript_4172/g.15621 Transcript_4172/m.15621 type:complete len:813 (-) Transcript_4172:1085-3523(-)
MRLQVFSHLLRLLELLLSGLLLLRCLSRVRPGNLHTLALFGQSPLRVRRLLCQALLRVGGLLQPAPRTLQLGSQLFHLRRGRQNELRNLLRRFRLRRLHRSFLLHNLHSLLRQRWRRLLLRRLGLRKFRGGQSCLLFRSFGRRDLIIGLWDLCRGLLLLHFLRLGKRCGLFLRRLLCRHLLYKLGNLCCKWLFRCFHKLLRLLLHKNSLLFDERSLLCRHLVYRLGNLCCKRLCRCFHKLLRLLLHKNSLLFHERSLLMHGKSLLLRRLLCRRLLYRLGNLCCKRLCRCFHKLLRLLLHKNSLLFHERNLLMHGKSLRWGRWRRLLLDCKVAHGCLHLGLGLVALLSGMLRASSLLGCGGFQLRHLLLHNLNLGPPCFKLPALLLSLLMGEVQGHFALLGDRFSLLLSEQSVLPLLLKLFGQGGLHGRDFLLGVLIRLLLHFLEQPVLGLLSPLPRKLLLRLPELLHLLPESCLRRGQALFGLCQGRCLHGGHALLHLLFDALVFDDLCNNAFRRIGEPGVLAAIDDGVALHHADRLGLLLLQHPLRQRLRAARDHGRLAEDLDLLLHGLLAHFGEHLLEGFLVQGVEVQILEGQLDQIFLLHPLLFFRLLCLLLWGDQLALRSCLRGLDVALRDLKRPAQTLGLLLCLVLLPQSSIVGLSKGREILLRGGDCGGLLLQASDRLELLHHAGLGLAPRGSEHILRGLHKQLPLLVLPSSRRLKLHRRCVLERLRRAVGPEPPVEGLELQEANLRDVVGVDACQKRLDRGFRGLLVAGQPQKHRNLSVLEAALHQLRLVQARAAVRVAAVEDAP